MGGRSLRFPAKSTKHYPQIDVPLERVSESQSTHGDKSWTEGSVMVNYLNTITLTAFSPICSNRAGPPSFRETAIKSVLFFRSKCTLNPSFSALNSRLFSFIYRLNVQSSGTTVPIMPWLTACGVMEHSCGVKIIRRISS